MIPVSFLLIRSQAAYSHGKAFMNEIHHTKTKGNIAETVVMLDLQKKGYIVFITTCEYSPIDIVAVNAHSGDTLRIQVKYRATTHVIPDSCNWSDKNGKHSIKINPNKIDYFAMVAGTEFNQIYYVKPSFMGKSVRTVLPKTTMPYYWWEDFKIGCNPNKRQTKIADLRPSNRNRPLPSIRKTIRPTREELVQMVWDRPILQLSKELGVSDVAIKKWCVKMGVPVPGRGYWRKIEAGTMEKLPAPILVHSEGFEPIIPSR